jgi:hypothetical protein
VIPVADRLLLVYSVVLLPMEGINVCVCVCFANTSWCFVCCLLVWSTETIVLHSMERGPIWGDAKVGCSDQVVGVFFINPPSRMARPRGVFESRK